MTPPAVVAFVLVTLIAAVVGANRAGRPRLDRPVLLGVLVVALVVGAFTYAARDRAVTDDQLALGVLFGAFFFGAVPPLAYYALGRLLARQPATLGFVWVASLIPLAFYFYIALLLTAAYVACPPGSYECPV